jgi:hypothetical protein
MEQNLDYKEACKEALNSMEEEYWKGAEAMLNHLRDDVTYCNSKDGCAICNSGNKFLKRRKK